MIFPSSGFSRLPVVNQNCINQMGRFWARSKGYVCMCVCLCACACLCVSLCTQIWASDLMSYFSCRTMYLLGYIPKDNRLYLGDKELNIVSYSLLVSVLEYQTAVMRRDFSMADKVLPTIPKEQRTRVAHFLEKQVRDFFHLVF